MMYVLVYMYMCMCDVRVYTMSLCMHMCMNAAHVCTFCVYDVCVSMNISNFGSGVCGWVLNVC